MDLCAHPRVRKLNVKKAGQIGGSEAIRNAIGRMAHQEPDPILLVLPNEKVGKKIFGKRILPLFEDTPCLAALKTNESRDQQLTQVVLSNGFTLSLGWSGSAATLASDPQRIVINDEVDKFEEWVGHEADPISLGEIRTATYEDSLVVNVSTPTTEQGLIHQLWDGSPVKLWFYVPCPHCRHYQRLLFDRVRYQKFESLGDAKHRAAAIETNGAAWYECEKCPERILDRHKPRMVNQGYWGTEDGGWKLWVDGHEDGEMPAGSEVGVHVSALYSLAAKHTFVLIAVEWVKCAGDPRKTQNFYNSWLGEIFAQLITKTDAGAIQAKRVETAKRLIVPKWAVALFATADTQKDHFYWVIRAWGYGERSQLIHHGVCKTFDELYQVALCSTFQGESGAQWHSAVLLIDSGGNATDASDTTRTQEVYQFAGRDPGRIWPTKGWHRPIPRLWAMTQRPNGVVLRKVDSGAYKDMLNRLIRDPDETKWTLHSEVDDDYCRQLASEHKVLDRKKRTMSWQPKTSGAANHYLDCEMQQCAAADMTNVALMKPPEPKQRSEENLATFGGSKRW